MSIDLTGKAVKHLLLPTVSYESSTIKIISAQQGDSRSRYFSVELYDDGGTIDVTGYTKVTLNATLPDGSKELYEGEIDAEAKRAICSLPSDILSQEGRVACDISFWKGTDDNKTVLTSQTFYVMVLPSQASDDAVIAQDKSGLLTNIIDNEQARIEAEEERKSAEEARISEEDTRKSNEESRKNAETARANAEKQRTTDETARKSAETARKTAEDGRVSAESERVTAEQGRVSAENTRNAQEKTRESNEASRKTAETTREANETTRKSNETARENAEKNRVTAETNRVTAESGRAKADETRSSAEETRKAQETARQNAETSRASTFNTLKSNAEAATKSANDAAQAAKSATVTSEVVEYQLTANGTLPESGWSGTMPAPAKGQYFWTRVTTTYGDNSVKTRVSVAYCGTDGKNGTNGTNGKDGKTPVSATIDDNGELIITWE